MIKLYYQNVENNFGDVLSKYIVEKVSGSSVQHSKTKSCDLVAIGSLGEVVAKKKFKRKILKGRDLHVWGTGFLLPGETYNNRFLNVHALRGELSKKRFRIKANIALGDPGILVSKLHDNLNSIPSESFVLCIPHAHDTDSKIWIDKVKEIYSEENVKVLSIKSSFIDIINAIKSSDFIFTTAMHPLIVSNSFGNNVIYITPRNVHPGGNYKLVDYFSAFDLEFKQCGIDFFINEINDKNEILDLSKNFSIPKARVLKIQNDLLEAFPNDLKSK